MSMSHAHPDGAADESVSIVDLQDSLEQLVPGHLILSIHSFQQVHRLWDPTGEVHQSVSCVPTIQSFVAAVHSAEVKKTTRWWVLFPVQQNGIRASENVLNGAQVCVIMFL